MAIETTEISNTPLFVACGMYAFTDQLRDAWQQLFKYFFELARPTFEINRLLNFDTGDAVLNNPALWFGQTCGYPLMTRLHQRLTPISVPIFDIVGCDGRHYSSQLIVPEKSGINSLQDCRGLRAVINASDSNSGMNVLRHAIAELNPQESFFSDIQVSGSHLQSLTEVANARADIAAIDCISYRFIEDTWPELTARIRSIGFTASTCGLPFVMQKQAAGRDNVAGISGCLNRALSMLDKQQKDRLHLKGFENVDITNYDGILELEVSAEAAGYPILV